MRIIIKSGTLVTVVLALASCRPNQAGSDAALRRYAATGDTNSLAIHLRTGTNANRTIWCGPRRDDFASLLHIAVEAGQLESVQLLLASGADPNQKDNEGRGPLMWTVGLTRNDVTLSKRERMMSLLIEGGGNPDLQDARGQAPLLWASSFGRATLVKLLIDSGADVAVKDENGNSALHLAKNAEVASLLMLAGADIHAINKNGETPAAMAKREGRLDALSAIAK